MVHLKCPTQRTPVSSSLNFASTFFCVAANCSRGQALLWWLSPQVIRLNVETTEEFVKLKNNSTKKQGLICDMNILTS